MKRQNLPSVLLTCGLFVLGGVNAAEPSVQPRKVEFDVAAQPMGDALNQFAKQSGVRIVFYAREAQGLTSRSATGSYTLEDALKLLLTGSNLQYRFVDSRTVEIRSQKAAASSPEVSWVVPDAGTVEALTGALLLAQQDANRDGEESSGKDSGKKSGRSMEGVEEMVVEEQRIKPFADRNVDRPRTINDEQPYYIFDAKTIERSGALSVEDFLKTRLTMNTTVLMNGQDPATGAGINSGNISNINMRGLGADKTLILVNGRRMANVVIGTSDRQTDLNGIPMSAIERIEVLPSSASGIYGASALGGVINVILKKEYSGGEVRFSYDNTWDTDAPIRRVSATFGQALEGGKTQVMLTGQWSDSKSLLFRDRRGLVDRGIRVALQNSPSSFYEAGLSFLGATPNLMGTAWYDAPTNTVIPAPAVLTLKDGRSLNAINTFVPAGTMPGTSLATLSDALFLNAGKWNMELPESTQSPNGLLHRLSAEPTMKSAMATVRRQMGSRVEAFLELSYQNNSAGLISNNMTNISIGANAPTNPFTTAVQVRLPSNYTSYHSTESLTRSAVAGLQIKMPRDWIGHLEYSWSENQYSNFYYTYDGVAIDADLQSGVLNPFVDSLQFPLNQARYVSPREYGGASSLDALALRGSGSFIALPWGVSTLTFGLEHRTSTVPESVYTDIKAFTIAENYRTTYFERESAVDSMYAELTVPLVATNKWPLVYAVDLQASGRSERYSVDMGTPAYTEYPNSPSRSSYSSPTLNGRPIRAMTSYTSNNTTFGLKYQPVESMTLRTSLGSAFLPPLASQLIANPVTSVSQVNDPQRNGAATPGVVIISGGNPNLKPQSAKSWNAGLIWEPMQMGLNGLRFNAEYYRINQYDRISSLGAQGIVNSESAYPGRVVRDQTGRIVSVDNSSVNLYRLSTEGWDFSTDYRRTTALGTLSIHAVQTYIMHEQRQENFVLPLLDYAGYVGEGGPGKTKASFSVSLERRNWLLGWATTLYGSYWQNGAAGGPASLRSSTPGRVTGTTVAMQGSESIPSQTYHDLYASYSFGDVQSAGRSGSMLSNALQGLDLQVGMKNVFNTMPPYDANYSGSLSYISPYGDKRMRTYWINATKRF